MRKSLRIFNSSFKVNSLILQPYHPPTHPKINQDQIHSHQTYTTTMRNQPPQETKTETTCKKPKVTCSYTYTSHLFAPLAAAWKVNRTEEEEAPRPIVHVRASRPGAAGTFRRYSSRIKRQLVVPSFFFFILFLLSSSPGLPRVIAHHGRLL